MDDSEKILNKMREKKVEPIYTESAMNDGLDSDPMLTPPRKKKLEQKFDNMIDGYPVKHKSRGGKDRDRHRGRDGDRALDKVKDKDDTINHEMDKEQKKTGKSELEQFTNVLHSIYSLDEQDKVKREKEKDKKERDERDKTKDKSRDREKDKKKKETRETKSEKQHKPSVHNITQNTTQHTVQQEQIQIHKKDSRPSRPSRDKDKPKDISNTRDIRDITKHKHKDTHKDNKPRETPKVKEKSKRESKDKKLIVKGNIVKHNPNTSQKSKLGKKFGKQFNIRLNAVYMDKDVVKSTKIDIINITVKQKDNHIDPSVYLDKIEKKILKKFNGKTFVSNQRIKISSMESVVIVNFIPTISSMSELVQQYIRNYVGKFGLELVKLEIFSETGAYSRIITK